MLMGMSDEDSSLFLERISATAIVNQAVIKCWLAGLAVTHDNVILFVGDFADPGKPAHAGLIFQIERSLDDVLQAAALSQLVREARH